MRSFGARLLGVEPSDIDEVGGSSHLNGDGTPLEACVSVGPRGRRLGLLADPAASLPVPGDLPSVLALARRVLRGLGGSSTVRFERLVATCFPSDSAGRARFTRGWVWLASEVGHPGLTAYAAAHPDPDVAWSVARRGAEALLHDASPALREIDTLESQGTLASLALDLRGGGDDVLKLYLRLRQAAPLAELGPEWAAPELAVFLARLMGSRRLALSGLVLSRAFAVADGRPVGCKVDVCGHCLRLSPEQWVETIEAVARAFSLPETGVGALLLARRAEVAFLGLGRKDDGEVRLNVYLKPRSPSASARRRAVQRAAEFLLATQQEDGHWSDYQLPVGPSTEWVTAFAGLALAFSGRVFGAAGAEEAGRRAAAWLQSQRSYPVGWGYNGRTGADADSTALALRLFHRLALPVAPEDTAFLLDHWKADGGFSTYRRADAWGRPHVCVTTQAFRALDADTRRPLIPSLRGFLAGTRLHGRGGWPAYWWTQPAYSTYGCLALLRELDVPLTACELPRSAQATAFDKAHAWGIAALSGAEADAERLHDELLSSQRGDGAWPGSPCLRVTDPGCADPWRRPKGATYSDGGVLTTAAVLVVLGEMTDAGH